MKETHQRTKKQSWMSYAQFLSALDKGEYKSVCNSTNGYLYFPKDGLGLEPSHVLYKYLVKHNVQPKESKHKCGGVLYPYTFVRDPEDGVVLNCPKSRQLDHICWVVDNNLPGAHEIIKDSCVRLGRTALFHIIKNGVYKEEYRSKFNTTITDTFLLPLMYAYGYITVRDLYALGVYELIGSLCSYKDIPDNLIAQGAKGVLKGCVAYKNEELATLVMSHITPVKEDITLSSLKSDFTLACMRKDLNSVKDIMKHVPLKSYDTFVLISVSNKYIPGVRYIVNSHPNMCAKSAYRMICGYHKRGSKIEMDVPCLTKFVGVVLKKITLDEIVEYALSDKRDPYVLMYYLETTGASDKLNTFLHHPSLFQGL